jgi:cytidyltransferase-like protein
MTLMPIPTVYTGGTFDLPHPGHYRLLQRAAQFGNVVVALNTDEFIYKYKGIYLKNTTYG